MVSEVKLLTIGFWSVCCLLDLLAVHDCSDDTVWVWWHFSSSHVTYRVPMTFSACWKAFNQSIKTHLQGGSK